MTKPGQSEPPKREAKRYHSLIAGFAMAAIGVLILAAISYFSLVTNNTGMSP